MKYLASLFVFIMLGCSDRGDGVLEDGLPSAEGAKWIKINSELGILIKKDENIYSKLRYPEAEIIREDGVHKSSGSTAVSKGYVGCFYAKIEDVWTAVEVMGADCEFDNKKVR